MNSFTDGHTNNEYLVKLMFSPQVSNRKLAMEHTFYYRLLAGLKDVYLRKPVNNELTDDDPFQLWLADRYLDNDIKARVLVQAYYMSLNINISQSA